MPQAIHISPIDNVVVALHPIAKGTLVEVDGLAVTALEDIPQGHKMAVKPIKNGENVIKYGFPIGHATADAAPGTWMHTHNVHTNLSGEVEYSYNPAPDLAPLPKVEPETFMGFRRKDGRAAIRNEIWIIPTVGCVNDIAKKMVADNQDLVTGSIEGLYTFTHPFGCSQTGHDHAQTRKLLAALVRHPNAAAVLVLHLGCENLQHDQFVEELGEYDHDRVKFLTCQDVEDEFAAARDILKELAAYGGWNTSSNTLGTVLSHLCAWNAAEKLGRLSEAVRDASEEFLFFRYLEDWGYMAEVRRDVTDHLTDIDPALNRLDLRDKEPVVRKIVKKRLEEFQAKYFPQEPYRFDLWMPWNRMFEVEIHLDYIDEL